MGEFDQLFGQSAPPRPQQVTIDVTGHDAAALDGFCRCLAMMASGSGPVPSEGLLSGLLAVQSVVWQIQSGFGLAASGAGWVAGFTELAEVGQRLLTLTSGGQEINLQVDSTGRFFAGTWQHPAGAVTPGVLTFAVNTTAGGSEFRAYWPVELAILLSSPIPGWTDSAPPVSAAAQPPAPAAPAAMPAARPMAAPAAIPSAAAGAATPGGWSLTIRGGPSAGQQIPLSGTLHIGRGVQNDLVLPDDAASRNHAAVEVSEIGCTVADLGSTNGTFVNGVRVEQATPLKDGDLLLCGQTEMAVAGPPPSFQAQKTVIIKIPVFAQPPQPAAAAPQPAGANCLYCGKPLVGSPKFCAFCGRQLR